MASILGRMALGAAALLAATGAHAQLLDPMYQDHVVIQRDRPIALWGKAQPHEKLTIALAGTSVEARAGKDGSWTAQLPLRPAGGPYALTVTGASGATQTVHDVMVGDVWLCSGQSNMEFAVAQSLNGAFEAGNAKDPDLRLLTVAHDTGADPKTAFKTPVSWQPATPESVRDFSAACYFMARELRKSQKVAMGLIDASWGGTAVNPWRSPASLEHDPAAAEGMALLATYRADRAKAAAQWGATWSGWWRARSGDAVGREPWQPDAPGTWKPVPSFEFWESWGDPELGQYNGIVWYRTDITLTAEQAAQAASITLGVIDDLDTSFVNGIGVGTTNSWDDLRDYPLARGTLHAGTNRIAVAVLDTYGPGGMHGPAEQRMLRFADGTSIPLPAPAQWQYRVTPGDNGVPHAPWEAIAGMGGIYNGMIAPLGAFGLRGAAWYQGETDANAPAGYAAKLAGLMSGWRAQFRNPELPFLIVQLPNWQERNTQPVENGFASIRDEERRAVAADAHAALAVTIDLGDVEDLHPKNKQGVGLRLARAAQTLVYGASASASGPLPASAAREGNAVRVRFKDVTGGLLTYSSGQAIAFELCGAGPGTCRFVTATASGSEVVLDAGTGPADRVRFCWGGSPMCNLTDGSGIPAAPFELAVQ